MIIGAYKFENPVILAPMAGVTDLPFRKLCARFGAAMVVSEMVSADAKLRYTRKSRLRRAHDEEISPRVIQIAGGCPTMMAEAAKVNVDEGADIIDINMGCPAKKVCSKVAGSSLLKDEKLVGQILEAVVAAVDVPVTLKTRLGWDWDSINIESILHMAESSGIQMLALHGRTRCDFYKHYADHQWIAKVKAKASIPVIANGDINTPEQAKAVLSLTGADGLMIGRAAQGRPWIFREINHYLNTGQILAPPSSNEVKQILIEHVQALYAFYGEYQGCRIARKHVGWYCKALSDAAEFRGRFNAIESAGEQLDMLNELPTASFDGA